MFIFTTKTGDVLRIPLSRKELRTEAAFIIQVFVQDPGNLNPSLACTRKLLGPGDSIIYYSYKLNWVHIYSGQSRGKFAFEE